MAQATDQGMDPMLRRVVPVLVCLLAAGGLVAAPAAQAARPTLLSELVQPQDVKVVDRGVGSVSLTWQAPSDSLLTTDYRVELRTISTAWSVYEDGVSDATQATVTGLATGVGYWFRVTSLGTGWESQPVVSSSSPTSAATIGIALGGSKTCLLMSNREERCWGSSLPQDGESLGYAQVMDISAEEDSDCGLFADGSVICRGLTSPALTDAVAVDSAGGNSPGGYACALRATATAVCWGANMYHQVSPSDQNPVGATDPGLTNVVAIAAGTATTCAVVASGHVFCWGYGQYGQIGDGQLATRSTPTEVTGISDAVDVSVGGGTACALHVSGAVSCWGNVFSDIAVFPNSASPVAVPGLNDAQSVSDGSTTCALRLSGTVYCWGWNGQGQIGDGTTTTRSSPVQMGDFDNAVAVAVGGEHSCALLDTGSLKCFGQNAAFPIPANQMSNPAILPAGPPSDVGNLAATSATASTVALHWTPASPDATPITGYRIQLMSGGQWVGQADLGPAASSFELTGLQAATSYRVRVVADSAAGQSNSHWIWVGTTGSGTTRATVVTPGGAEVVGGSVTWQTADGDFRSSQPYGLTANGVVDLQRTPAQSGVVRLVGGTLPNGAKVTGQWAVRFRAGGLVLVTPPPPSTGTKTVRTLLPNGESVAGSQITVSGLSAETHLSGFTFDAPPGARSGTTDGSGFFMASGYPSGAPSATAVYDDGVLWQRVRDVPLAQDSTDIAFQEMPWLEVGQETMSADANDTVGVQIVVTPAGFSGRTELGSRGTAASRSVAGVRVRIAPPAGANQSACQAKLSGLTDQRGRVTLRVCATKSGVYRIRGEGAAATSWLMLKVRGAAPLPPTSVSGISPRLGAAKIAWNVPLFAGGATISSYKVKLVGGGKTVVKTVSGARRSVIWTGLRHAVTYSASVVAVTRFGASPPAVTRVPVA